MYNYNYVGLNYNIIISAVLLLYTFFHLINHYNQLCVQYIYIYI